MTKTPQNFYALPVMTDSNQPTQTPTLLSQQQPANYHHNLLTHDNFNQNNNNLSVGMPFMNTNNIHYHPQVASDINPFPVYDNPYYYTHYRGIHD